MSHYQSLSRKLVRHAVIATLAGTVAMAWTLSGCGSGEPALGRVTGTVTIDGAPLADALVHFQPDSGRASLGRTDSQGRYDLNYSDGLKGAIPGDHIVRISTAVVRWSEKAQDERAAPETVPKRYNRQSELKATVVSGSNSIDFTLKSDAK